MVGKLAAAPITDRPFDAPISLGLTPGNPIGQPIGSPASPEARAKAQSPADWSQAAIDAQKPLIDAQTENQSADTALKKQALEGAKYDLKRKMGQRFQHRISGGIGKTMMSAADQAKASGSSGVPIMGGNRIQNGKAIVSTPSLDTLPKISSSVDAMGNAVATPTNPNAATVAQIRSPGIRPVPLRPTVAPPGVTSAPSATRGGVAGSANIVRGKFGGGYGFTPSPSPGGSATVMRPPLRPRKVSQSAIVNPRVNPLFKTAVA